jgi:hypothetical protein
LFVRKRRDRQGAAHPIAYEFEPAHVASVDDIRAARVFAMLNRGATGRTCPDKVTHVVGHQFVLRRTREFRCFASGSFVSKKSEAT